MPSGVNLFFLMLAAVVAVVLVLYIVDRMA